MHAAGADVWGAADEFMFVHRPLTGDGTIVARVTDLRNTHAWAKAGVMIRESLTAGAKNGFMLVSASNGLLYQRRTATGGTSVATSGGGAAAPAW